MSTTSAEHEQQQLVQFDGAKTSLSLPVGYRVPVRKNSEYIDDLLRKVYGHVPATDALVLGVVSCTDDDAASVMTINLATRATDYLMTPTLVVDANLRAGRISRKLGARRPGFADYVAGTSTLKQCTSPTKVNDMHVMGIGGRNRRAQSLLPTALRELREEFRMSFVEFPPLTGPAPFDSFISELDGVIVLAQYGQKKRQLDKMTNHIRSCGGDILGLVMTGRPSAMPNWLTRWF